MTSGLVMFLCWYSPGRPARRYLQEKHDCVTRCSSVCSGAHGSKYAQVRPGGQLQTTTSSFTGQGQCSLTATQGRPVTANGGGESLAWECHAEGRTGTEPLCPDPVLVGVLLSIILGYTLLL